MLDFKKVERVVRIVVNKKVAAGRVAIFVITGRPLPWLGS